MKSKRRKFDLPESTLRVMERMLRTPPTPHSAELKRKRPTDGETKTKGLDRRNTDNGVREPEAGNAGRSGKGQGRTRSARA